MRGFITYIERCCREISCSILGNEKLIDRVVIGKVAILYLVFLFCFLIEGDVTGKVEIVYLQILEIIWRDVIGKVAIVYLGVL